MKRFEILPLIACAVVGVASAALTVRAENILHRENVIIDAGTNPFAADGSVTVGDNGLNLRYADWATPFVAAKSGIAVTLIAEVEDIPLAEDGALKTLLTVYVANSVGTTLDVDAEGYLSADWNHGKSGFFKKSTKTITPGRHRIALVYKNGWGAQGYVDGEAWTDCTGASASSGAITRAYVGQFGATGTGWDPCAAKGMKVLRMAVIDRQLTAEEIAAYDWTAPAHYARFAADFKDRVVTCTAGNLADISGNNFRASRFDVLNGSRTTPDYLGGTDSSVLPGYTGTAAFWHAFCKGLTGHVSPGLVLRFPPSPDANGFSLDGGFSPLNLGGLIVEAGANPGSKPVRFYEVEGKNRTTFLGDTTGKVETHFVFNDDLVLDRRGECKFYGTLNFDIAEGKNFDCTTGNVDVRTTMANSARLKMRGAGTLKVRTLTAFDATLDFSDLPLDRAAPYIDGNLAIDSSTRLVFPAGFEAGRSYALCSGTVQSGKPTFVIAITVGGVEKKVVLTVSGNAVSYSEPTAFVDGVPYDSLQEAFDDSGEGSKLEVCKGGSVTVGADKTLKDLVLAADLEVSGESTLTLADGGRIDVLGGQVLTCGTPVALAGAISKAGAGKATFNGAFGATIGVEDAQLVVVAGSADFDGAVSGVTICGRGTLADETDWPVITLLANCTVDLTTSLVSPALANGVACYGKVVQAGAVASTTTADPCLMDPCGGACAYVLNDGVFDVGAKSINFLHTNRAKGRVLFEQNGGTLKAKTITVCRVFLTPKLNEEYYRYVLNGGVLQSYLSSARQDDAHDLEHLPEKVRFDMNGGTYDVGANTSLVAAGTLAFSINGDVTLKNGAGVTTVVPSEYASGDIGLLTLAGAGTFDFSSVMAISADGIAVVGGAAILNGALLDANSTLSIASGAKVGLAYDGVEDIRALMLGNRSGVKDRVCGYGRSAARYFIETAPAGAVKPLEGREAEGLSLILR